MSAGPIYPQYWAFDSTVPMYPFDPAGATALLDAAGYRLRQPTRPSAGPPARLRFTCLVPKDFTIWQRIALEVQRDLLNVGVDMQFQEVPLREFGGVDTERAVRGCVYQYDQRSDTLALVYVVALGT